MHLTPERRARHRRRGRWSGDETLNTTALVHEAFLHLVDQSSPHWANHPHFLAVAATARRRVLLDNAKRKNAAKRDGGRQVSLAGVEAALGNGQALADAGSEAILALEESLVRLEREDPLQGRVVECRFFGDMTVEDTAAALGISPATVKRRWAVAQAWLYRDLTRTPGATHD